MVSVFLSYAHEDTEFVNKLVVHLMRLGYDVIQDTKTLSPVPTSGAPLRTASIKRIALFRC